MITQTPMEIKQIYSIRLNQPTETGKVQDSKPKVKKTNYFMILLIL